MMEASFKELVDALSTIPLPTDLLPNIVALIEQQTPQSLPSFLAQNIQSLLHLKHWSWQQLTRDSHQPDCITLLHSLASFNKNLIFDDDHTDDETKASLLIPDSIDHIDGMFEQINRSNDENSTLIIIVNLWLDNLSFFIHDYPQFNKSSIIGHINEYVARNYLMTDRFLFYLVELQEEQITQAVFTARQLFYIKTCLFCLAVYLFADAQRFPFTPEEMLQHVGSGYLQIMSVHSRTIEHWTDELLVCITQLTGFLHSCCWWGGGERKVQTEILFRNEQVSCDFAQALIQMIIYEPFHREIKPKRCNNATILIHFILKFILFMIHRENMTWFFRLNQLLPKTMLKFVENSKGDEINNCAYGVLGEVLTDEKLKELKVTDTSTVFFHMLREGWHHPSKKYKQIPLLHMLKGFFTLTKSDAIQQRIADINQVPLFTEMTDEYPIVYDILWALSFNRDIQQQLRSCPKFMVKVANLAKECDDEKMRKVIHGIRWNLEITHEDHATSDMKDRDSFDIMISYSHKDKVLCKQIYDDLIQAGYRVWIDFDQMHGNVMDAMAHAIEQSPTVIVCMSEHYRKSNYCRAEAHYAFQRERKIVPVLLQKHYKPDGWLLFLIGQLLYVDFNKYELSKAMAILFIELRSHQIVETNQPTIQHEEKTTPIPPMLTPKASSSLLLSQNILEWSPEDVQTWLIRHDLHRMARLLKDCDGRSLLYLNKYMRSGESQQILKLLQSDSLHLTKEDLSLIELSRFRSLVDEQRRSLSTK